MISRGELARLVRAAERAAPAEACGVLGARRDGDDVRLLVVPMRAASSPNGFAITRRQLALARRALTRRGLVLCGCFHSHPTLGPKPSALDRSSMARAPLWWLIYSNRRRSLRMLRVLDGRVERARLRVG